MSDVGEECRVRADSSGNYDPDKSELAEDGTFRVDRKYSVFVEVSSEKGRIANGGIFQPLNRGTTSELIKNGENGILIEDDRLGELPQIINNLLENNEERKRIAKNGQRTILEQWPSWEERVRDEVDLVEKLAGNKVGV